MRDIYIEEKNASHSTTAIHRFDECLSLFANKRRHGETKVINIWWHPRLVRRLSLTMLARQLRLLSFYPLTSDLGQTLVRPIFDLFFGPAAQTRVFRYNSHLDCKSSLKKMDAPTYRQDHPSLDVSNHRIRFTSVHLQHHLRRCCDCFIYLQVHSKTKFTKARAWPSRQFHSASNRVCSPNLCFRSPRDGRIRPKHVMNKFVARWHRAIQAEIGSRMEVLFVWICESGVGASLLIIRLWTASLFNSLCPHCALAFEKILFLVFFWLLRFSISTFLDIICGLP